MNACTQQRLTAGAFVVCCVIVSFSVSHMFPQGEQWLDDEQLSLWPSQPLSASIVMVRADDRSPALCGDGRWNLNVLQATFLSLHQAGAMRIAPMLNVSLPVAPECGGLSGLVQLAEVTKQVGTVVYPDTVAPALAKAALQTGFTGLSVNEFRKSRGFTLPPSSLLPPKIPLGIEVGSSMETSQTLLPTGSSLFVPGVDKTNGREVFPHQHFRDVWKLVQRGESEKLKGLFHGKIMFFYADVSRGVPASTEQFSGPPVAFLHARLANAYLTNAWVVPAPFSMAFFISVSLGWGLFASFKGEWSLRRLGFVSGIVVLLGALLIFLGFQWGWMWPLFSMGLTCGLILIGVGAWKWSRSRSTVHQHIATREQQLRELEYELSGKQGLVRQLEAQLSDAQDQSSQSVYVIEELRMANDTSRSQLEKFHQEVQETRRKIVCLQEEIQELRQQIPVSSVEGPTGVQAVADRELMQECEAFQIVTRDPGVLRLFHHLKKAAVTQVPILLLGETGTGKEVFAKAAHALSARRQRPFISVNMAAIRSELFEGELFGHVKGAFTGAVGRKGFLETAHGGTLFLDEVGDLPVDVQAKLLRFLEDGGFYRVGQSVVTHVDVRIVAATNRDLQDEVREGRYREDLYYRLRSIVLTLPPLRQRNPADHALLAQWFLRECVQLQQRASLTFTQGALEAIMAYPWPGNIRELRQTIAQAVALAHGPVITEAELNLPGPYASGFGEGGIKHDVGCQEDAMVLECLRRHQFDMQATAATLGWDRGTVTQRLKGLGFQSLMEYHGDIHAAAQALAGEEKYVRIVEGRLREYTKNLVPASKRYGSVDEAIADCRKRFRNLPERHFPAVEHLLHERFGAT